MTASGNIFAKALQDFERENIDTLLQTRGVRIERIVSTGQATAPGEWYDQPWREWVILLQGSALLQIESESQARRLVAGDWIELDPHLRHRVEETSADPQAIWLAVHIE